MKTSIAMAIVSTALLSGLAFAQPQVPNPVEPQVPSVQQPGVDNPAPPEIPSAAGTGSDLPIVDSSTYGACPTTQCANGNVPSSEVHCSPGEAAVCTCDGFCDSDGNPQGLNRCACE
jgi:hypothetical protein